MRVKPSAAQQEQVARHGSGAWTQSSIVTVSSTPTARWITLACGCCSALSGSKQSGIDHFLHQAVVPRQPVKLAVANSGRRGCRQPRSRRSGRRIDDRARRSVLPIVTSQTAAPQPSPCNSAFTASTRASHRHASRSAPLAAPMGDPVQRRRRSALLATSPAVACRPCRPRPPTGRYPDAPETNPRLVLRTSPTWLQATERNRRPPIPSPRLNDAWNSLRIAMAPHCDYDKTLDRLQSIQSSYLATNGATGNTHLPAVPAAEKTDMGCFCKQAVACVATGRANGGQGQASRPGPSRDCGTRRRSSRRLVPALAGTLATASPSRWAPDLGMAARSSCRSRCDVRAAVGFTVDFLGQWCRRRARLHRSISGSASAGPTGRSSRRIGRIIRTLNLRVWTMLAATRGGLTRHGTMWLALLNDEAGCGPACTVGHPGPARRAVHLQANLTLEASSVSHGAANLASAYSAKLKALAAARIAIFEMLTAGRRHPGGSD